MEIARELHPNIALPTRPRIDPPQATSRPSTTTLEGIKDALTDTLVTKMRTKFADESDDVAAIIADEVAGFMSLTGSVKDSDIAKTAEGDPVDGFGMSPLDQFGIFREVASALKLDTKWCGAACADSYSAVWRAARWTCRKLSSHGTRTMVESSNGYRLQQIINDYKVVIFYPLVDAPIRSTVVLDQKLIVLQRTLSSQL